MAKAGDKVTDANGKTWVATQGGNWRLYENGKPTGTVSKTNPAAGGGAGAAGAGTPTAVENTTPQKLSPAGIAYLDKAKNDLQAQVAAHAISQAQADQQYAIEKNKIGGLSPALQDSAWNLANQNISQADKDNELYRQQTLENQSQPNTSTSLTDKSSTADVQNEIADSAKGYTQAGNVLTNPNQNGPFGNRNVTINPVTGQPEINDTLSGANQGVLGGIQGTSVKASDVAQGLLGGQYQNFVSGAGPQSGPSQQLQDAIYGHLTQGFSAQKKQEYEDKSQELANRGIPVGSDAYNKEMNRLDLSWQQKEGDARNQAVSGAYGQSVAQQGANTASLNAATGSLNTLGAVGQGGFYQPNFQQFNAAQYQQPDVQGLYNTQYAGQLTREQIQAQIEQQKIQAGATLGAAGIAAEASKSNAATAANSRPQTSAFVGPPPGS